MKGLIFLDFDGVINQCDKQGWMITRTESGLDPILVRNVATLVEATGASVVLSTTWREQEDFTVLKQLLQDHGLAPQHVVGTTPIIVECARGFEIAQYLDQERHEGRFVVLDDNDTGRFDMVPVRNHLVQTDCRAGFVQRDLKRAKYLLTEGAVWAPSLQFTGV